MNTAALLYLRGTDAKCAEQRTAITNAYAKRFDFVRVFEDESPSNSYLQSRPGGKKLIAALLESSVRVVLVTQPLMIAAQKQCVDFLFFCERMAEGVQVLTLDGVDLVAGLQANKRRLKAEGKRIAGKLPYGHGSDPKERAVLTRMLAMKAEGVSAYAIAKVLNEEGVRTRTGARWFEPSVFRVLKRGLPRVNKETE